VVGIILFALWLKWIDPAQTMAWMHHIRPQWLVASGMLYLLAYFVRSLRWQALLKPVKHIPAGRMYLTLMAGNFLNYLIPIRAGEVAKCYFLKRTEGVRISHTLPSVFIDKLFDSAAILIVLILLPFLPVHLPEALWGLIYGLIVILLAGAGVLVLAAIAHNRMVKVFRFFSFMLPKRYEERFFEVVHLFVEGVGVFRHHLYLLPQVLFFTFLAVGIDSAFFYTVFLAFGQNIGYITVLFGYTLIYLSYALPHPPAQIGSNEILMVAIFSVGFGLSKDMVSAVMACSHLMTGILIAIMGWAGISYAGLHIMDFWKKEHEVSEDE
jgi:uncharacterized protein (TIRG00374 family)